MGLFDFLRKGEERAIPEPGTPEFEAAVKGSALPDSQSVEMGQPGWASTMGEGEAQVETTRQTIDLRGTGAREDVEEVLREHGIDPDKEGQTIDASSKPGLQRALLEALFTRGVDIPNAGGFGGGVSPPKQDRLAQIEHLAKKRDAGEISEAEFEAQKRHLLGS
jgi:hypothetical protein